MVEVVNFLCIVYICYAVVYSLLSTEEIWHVWKIAVQMADDAALLQQLEGDSNSEDNDQDSASAQVIGADDMLFSDFDADKDPKSLSPGEMETCLNEMQLAASRSHGWATEHLSSAESDYSVLDNWQVIELHNFYIHRVSKKQAKLFSL